MARYVRVRDLSACLPMVCITSYVMRPIQNVILFFGVQGPLKMLQMIPGHPLSHLTLPIALPHRSLTTHFPPVGHMDVHVVQVLRGMAPSDPIILTRDASALNIPF